MDGFFVAKLKVEKRSKGLKAEEAEGPQMKLNDVGELVEEKQAVSAFNADEDAAIIKGKSFLLHALPALESFLPLTILDGKKKHLLKTKGIKIRNGKA